MITQEQAERIAEQIAGCQQDAGWELVEFPPGRILTEYAQPTASAGTWEGLWPAIQRRRSPPEYVAYQQSSEQYVPSIVKMCIWMEVSRSGFYGWRDRPESATAKRRGILALYVKKSFGDSDGTYGYRRVHADLVAWGVPAGPELARSVMRELGLEPCQPRPWRVSLTEGDGQEPGPRAGSGGYRVTPVSAAQYLSSRSWILRSRAAGCAVRGFW